MAETRITPITPVSPFLPENSPDPQLGAVVPVAADIVNGNVVAIDTGIILRLVNTDVAIRNVTITSTNDPHGRLADIVFAIPIGGIVNRKFVKTGWADGNGDLKFVADNVLILVEAYQV